MAHGLLHRPLGGSQEYTTCELTRELAPESIRNNFLQSSLSCFCRRFPVLYTVEDRVSGLGMEPEQLVISSISVQNFKSITGAALIQFRRSQGRLIALVGVNGAGESWQQLCRLCAAFHCSVLPLCSLTGQLLLVVAGKTVCLEAVAFACGAPVSHLRVQQFRDLAGGSQLPTVAVLWKSCAGKELKLQTTLNKGRGDRCAPVTTSAPQPH